MKKKKNVYDVIRKDNRFRILTKILEKTGLDKAMSKEKEIFTFFAPTDVAFCKLSKKALQILASPEGKGLVAAIIAQHLVPKSYLYANDLRAKDSIETVHGNKLQITEEGNILQLEEAHILMPGIAASNGVVFPIDKVLPARTKSAAATA